jgi:alpha-1,6-mannosyltransferase
LKSRWRRPIGLLGLAGLVVAAVPLAAPGAGLVPAAGGGAPSWLLGVYGPGLGLGGGAYYGFLWLAFASYICVLLGASALPRRLLWTVIVCAVLAFALAPPLLSRDVFSYIDYSRLGVEHGLNPYLAVPADAPADPALAHVGWPSAVSAYGPLFTLITYALGEAGLATALWVLKAFAAASVLGLAVLCARLAPARALDPRPAAALVALNPLVLVHVVGGAHNDGLMMLLVMGGVAAGASSLERGEAGMLAGAAGVKIAALFVAPFALLGAGRSRRLLIAGALAFALLAAVSGLAFGAHPLAVLGPIGGDQAATTRYSVPRFVSGLLGVGVVPFHLGLLILYAGFVAWLLRRTWLGADWVRGAAWAAVGLLVATGWLLPWYLIWALPLVALVRDRPLLAAMLAMTAFQLVNRVPL